MGLDVVLKRSPEEPGSSDEFKGTDISFGPDEYDNFFNELGAESIIQTEGEDYADFYRRRDEAFKASLAGYPLLARITDYYDDASFAPDEIEALRAECMPLRKRMSDSDAQSFLEGLLRACDLAQANGMGIFLAAD